MGAVVGRTNKQVERRGKRDLGMERAMHGAAAAAAASRRYIMCDGARIGNIIDS